MVGQKNIKYRKSYFLITPTAVKFCTMKVLIPEWDLRSKFNLGFPELNSGYSLRDVTTWDMFL